MIGPIEFALLCGLALAAYTFYKAQTTHMALNARHAMTDAVCEILHDPCAPEDLKLSAIAAFYAAGKSSFVPRTMLSLLQHKTEPDARALNNEHQMVLRNLMRSHFQRVNMLAAPHFYLLFWLLVVTTLLVISVLSLGQKSGFRLYQKTEEVMINPPLRDPLWLVRVP